MTTIVGAALRLASDLSPVERRHLGAPWYAGALVVVAAAVAALAVVGTARRRLGGISGDVLGATIEVSLAAALVAAAVLAVR